MIRILAFLAGLSGAVGLSQFPAFSQQYLQRLAGAVDALSVSVARFDADARAAGLSREAALGEYARAGAFLAAQGQARADEIARFERLRADYDALRAAAPLQRLSLVHRFGDAELARGTWDDFRPALPATFDGMICALVGYAAAGWPWCWGSAVWGGWCDAAAWRGRGRRDKSRPTARQTVGRDLSRRAPGRVAPQPGQTFRAPWAADRCLSADAKPAQLDAPARPVKGRT
jgi:outer membrane murein-binding lipoprotein Lpp